MHTIYIINFKNLFKKLIVFDTNEIAHPKLIIHGVEKEIPNSS